MKVWHRTKEQKWTKKAFEVAVDGENSQAPVNIVKTGCVCQFSFSRSHTSVFCAKGRKAQRQKRNEWENDLMRRKSEKSCERSKWRCFYHGAQSAMLVDALCSYGEKRENIPGRGKGCFTVDIFSRAVLT